MVVLALDTATRQGSAALLVDGTCDARAGDAARTHGERLPGELLALLAAHDLTLRDVDLLAVVAGPGSFTGLRVGMAAVQGLALATGRLVVPVPTLEAIVESWRTSSAGRSTLDAEAGTRNLGTPEPRNLGTPEPRNLVIACLDGQRGDVFFAAWRLALDEPIEAAANLVEPSVGTAQDLVDRIRRDRLTPSVIVGVGLDRHAETLGELRVPIRRLPTPLADVAARIAARRPERAMAPHALRPIYIRRPDAVLARERAGL